MQLAQFLVRAKQASYASLDAGLTTTQTLPDGSKEIVFQDGAFSYRDRYFGWNPFAGEEVVFHHGHALWVMHYHGQVLAAELDAARLYHFLQQALGQVQQQRPFRGPQHWQDGDLAYFDHSCGGWEQFSGEETIRQDGREVYRLLYHGGLVKGRDEV